jgi:hypothetical protein
LSAWKSPYFALVGGDVAADGHWHPPCFLF